MPRHISTCTHCGEQIASESPVSNTAWQWVHLGPGGYNGKHRCDPDKSGLMYGYEAHPAEIECDTCPNAPGA